MNKKPDELTIVNNLLLFAEEDKEKRAAELIIANKELAFQSEARENCAAELIIANQELIFQKDEKEIRAAELVIANKELVFQNKEKEKRAAELIIANKELAFQNEEKEKRAAELIIVNKELAFQNEEKEKRETELVIANKELAYQNNEKEKRASELFNANRELKHAEDELEQKVIERTAQLESANKELEKLNHELKNLSTSKDKFLSVISHDLRNPLTALLLASNELNRQSENKLFDPIQPIVKVIHRSSNNILQQLNELVDWAKKQQEKTMINPEKIHLFSAVDNSFELLKAYATQKNIHFVNKVPSGIYVNADALMLRSILQNLVTNAIKYSLNGGEVTVTAEHIGNLIEVCVVDAGIGMDAHTRKNLFAKSQAASITGTNNEKGSGLGLLLVKDFVTQLGGSLKVESETAKGACVYFTVPGC